MANQPIHGYFHDDSEPEVSTTLHQLNDLNLIKFDIYDQTNEPNGGAASDSTSITSGDQAPVNRNGSAPTSTSNQVRILRLRLIAGHNLAKKDIFGASDPYVRIDLVSQQDNRVIDSVYTKTKKRVRL